MLFFNPLISLYFKLKIVMDICAQFQIFTFHDKIITSTNFYGILYFFIHLRLKIILFITLISYCFNSIKTYSCFHDITSCYFFNIFGTFYIIFHITIKTLSTHHMVPMLVILKWQKMNIICALPLPLPNVFCSAIIFLPTPLSHPYVLY